MFKRGCCWPPLRRQPPCNQLDWCQLWHLAPCLRKASWLLKELAAASHSMRWAAAPILLGRKWLKAPQEWAGMGQAGSPGGRQEVCHYRGRQTGCCLSSWGWGVCFVAKCRELTAGYGCGEGVGTPPSVEGCREGVWGQLRTSMLGRWPCHITPCWPWGWGHLCEAKLPVKCWSPACKLSLLAASCASWSVRVWDGTADKG